MALDVSVVVPTRDRPEQFAALVEGLRNQTLARERFEVIVVDDGSDRPPEPAWGQLDGRVVRQECAQGPGAARNAGWRASRAPLVAFIDDDCVPVAGWLAALVAEAAGPPRDVVVQGPVRPPPDQAHAVRPLSHVIEVTGPDRLFATCNILYSRPLLERLDGFDESFRRSAEDVELGARARKAGAAAMFADQAVVYHEVRQPSAVELLRHTTKWSYSVKAVALHPELRELLVSRIFWKPTHPRLLLALAGLMTGRRSLAALAVVPYLTHYWRLYRGWPEELGRAVPVHLAVDLCEIGTMVAGSVQYRTLML